MGEVGNNEANTNQPVQPEKIQPEAAKKLSLGQKLRSLFKRNKTATSPNHSTESLISIPAESGYRKLIQSFDKEKEFDSPMFPGHKYKGEQVQKMFENVFPDLVKKLSGTSSSTSSIEQLSQLHEGDVATIYNTLGKIQSKLEERLPKENKTASPDFLKVSQINIIRSLLQKQIETQQKEALQKKLKEAIKTGDPTEKNNELKKDELLNPLADKQIDQVLAGNKETH